MKSGLILASLRVVQSVQNANGMEGETSSSQVQKELVDESGRLTSQWGNGAEKADCCKCRVYCNKTYHVVRLDI